MRAAVSLSLCVLQLVFAVSISEANYEFTVHFYEFRNPLGLQCGECESGGSPACCDDVQRNESCIMTRPFTCDTSFRFLLRQFGAPMETAPSGIFPHFTPSSGGNSDEFSEGPGAVFSLPNPFIISSISEWRGKIQFFIDAIDRRARSNETQAIINRFPIDLELEVGADFTEKTTYTGIYSIPGLGFDMIFRVQCSENYYDPNCTTFCEPMEGVYACSSEGTPICLQRNQSFCTQCLSSLNPSLSCATCLDPSTNCTDCHNRNFDPSTNCTDCHNRNLDPSMNCINKCPPGFIQMGSTCTKREESTDLEEVISSMPETGTDLIDGGSNMALVGGVAGGGLAALVVIIILILCISVVVIQKRKRTKYNAAGTTTGRDNVYMYITRDSSVKEAAGTSRLGGKNFVDNPLYRKSNQNGSQWEGDNSAYSKLQRPPVQKSFVPPKFPYTTEHAENQSSSKATAAPLYDYAVLSTSSPPPLVAAANDPTAAHEYAETDDVMKGSCDASKSPAYAYAYANTTAGKVTPA